MINASMREGTIFLDEHEHFCFGKLHENEPTASIAKSCVRPFFATRITILGSELLDKCS